MTATISVGRSLVILGLALAAVGCSGSATSTPAMTPTIATAGPTGTPAVPTEPPEIALLVEGGDPVAGQLGTYTWGDGGSDAPWLTGAPLRVGPGERLAARVEPFAAVSAWEAQVVPWDADGPAGAVPLGSGSGEPAFPAPNPGRWTIHLEVTYAAGLGSANYFWQVDVE
ncbi:MAG: hypothetical protein WEC14_04390 [Chloroflexota bacterium]